jgi:ribonuclease R
MRKKRSKDSKKGKRSSQGGSKRDSRAEKQSSRNDRAPDRSSLRPQHLPPLRGNKPEYVSSADRGGSKPKVRTITGSIDKHRKGFAHLSLKDDEFEDLFLNPHEAKRYFHGDRVRVQIAPSGEVIEMELIEHRFSEVVGVYASRPSRRGSEHGRGVVIYQRRNAREEIPVKKPPAQAKDDDWVRAALEFRDDGQVYAEISEVYGPELPAIADLPMVAGEYSLIEEHSEAAKEEARSKKLEIPGRDEQNRTDLRDKFFVTIDGETARDFDDAVYVEKTPNGFQLWVAIADVSHYVEEGSVLDQEAYERATSVYFPERAFHMLPSELSENLCSLRPNEPRLAFVCRIDLDSKGAFVGTELIEGIIQSQRRATYTEIQAEWDERKDDPKALSSWPFAAHFELYQTLRKKRVERGSIDFELPEPEIVVDEKGEPTRLEIRPRFDAHRLIEEFMIAANEAVTEWVLERQWPFVYRIHERPEESALQKFASIADSVGFSIESLGENTPPKVLANIANQIQGHPAEILLNSTLLRSMKQARYDAFHEGHYGLASGAYTHFTSPIRRYPDLLVHRILRRIVRDGAESLSDSDKQALDAQLSEQTEHCSYRERIASTAERESIRLKQVRIAKQHLGDEFEGRIVGMMEKGFFVQVDDPFFEGMVSRDNLNDDFYQFNEERMMFVGKRKRRIFRLGDLVKIRVEAASLELRRVDLDFVETIASLDVGGADFPTKSPHRRSKSKKDRRSDKKGRGSDSRSKKKRGSKRGKGKKTKR